VYNFPVAALDRKSRFDPAALEMLNTLYSSFDIFGQDQMDWRCFLFMVRPMPSSQPC
jgi:hypothetical protein